MNFEQEFMAEMADVKAHFKGFKVVPKKDSWICTSLYWILKVLSFGKLDFNNFITVLGQNMYVTDDWSSMPYGTRWEILRHERVHFEQAKKLGLGCFWLGYPFFVILYLFVLPFGLTFRSWFELEAYRESARCGKMAGNPLSRERLRQLLMGPSYLWACLIPWLVDYWLRDMPDLES